MVFLLISRPTSAVCQTGFTRSLLAANTIASTVSDQHAGVTGGVSLIATSRHGATAKAAVPWMSATMNRIHLTSGDLQRGHACFRVNRLAFLGYAGRFQAVARRCSRAHSSKPVSWMPSARAYSGRAG